MQFCNLKNKKTLMFSQIGCFGGQIFQTRPNFIDLGALVCDSYQGSKLTLASSHFANEFHETASAKLYHTHFSATRTLALIIHDSHQN